MIDFLTALLLVACLITMVYWASGESPDQQQRLVDELHRADQVIESEFRRARRAMNDAAQQSWRNLADYDS